jgi:hypothetical protein
VNFWEYRDDFRLIDRSQICLVFWLDRALINTYVFIIGITDRLGYFLFNFLACVSQGSLFYAGAFFLDNFLDRVALFCE